MSSINVLSLFDGISCGQVALNRANIPYNTYYASEIDPDSIRVTQHNYPNTRQLGDVKNVRGSDLPQIDLLLAGSPCQGFSKAGKKLNLDDPRSSLFFEFLRIKEETKPRYFLLENVLMKQEYQDIITEYLGVSPYKINSSLLSAQTRTRLYWTNLPIEELEDCQLVLGDIMEDVDDYLDTSRLLNPVFGENCVQYDLNGKGNKSQGHRAYYIYGKSCTLTCSILPKLYISDECVRYFTQRELERLQTLPDNYTSILPINKAKKAIGNGWTVDVIVEFLKHIQ